MQRTPQTIPELRNAARAIERWLVWEKDSLPLFHAYAQRYGGRPGENVYLFVLAHALQRHAVTLEQFKKEVVAKRPAAVRTNSVRGTSNH